MGFVNVTVSSTPISGISHSQNLYFSSFDFKLAKAISEIPTGEQELIFDHPGDGKFLKTFDMSFVKLFKHIFHFLIIPNLSDAHLFQEANTLLHSFIETNIFSREFVIKSVTTIHDCIVLVVVGSGPDGFKGLF